MLRGKERGRSALAIVALLALALRIIVPAGYMPGTSLAQPIILCAGQGPMPDMVMDHGRHGRSDPSSHDSDHPCAFAGLGAPTLAAPFEPPHLQIALVESEPVAIARHVVAPGRGMAAPPPPSHAPPLRTA